MPFKQKAKKNKEGSSSSAPAKRDLASRYKAPFPIYTIKEGECFTRLAKSSFTGQSSFNPRSAANKWFKDESILYLHKYFCYALFGRVEASKVQTKDLFVLETLLQGKRVDISGVVLDTIYNASRHQGKVTLGVGSMALILTYAAHMPIPPYRTQPTDIFRYMDGAFLKKTGLVDEVKTGNTVAYRWKSWERRVGQCDRDAGTSRAHEQRQRKGKSPSTSSPHAEEEEEVAGWKQVLSKVDAL
ncbi:hypothetical protein JCGZ_17487 [Jatropha curcas]|uniref:Uncharacterized protein n=1 Tax=Jatropha curcas TaxID=180498 RepID=A0A067KDL7_JATCU|nr:hypothetical protein JCGZ_17487 [Jatropha curcas]